MNDYLLGESKLIIKFARETLTSNSHCTPYKCDHTTNVKLSSWPKTFIFLKYKTSDTSLHLPTTFKAYICTKKYKNICNQFELWFSTHIDRHHNKHKLFKLSKTVRNILLFTNIHRNLLLLLTYNTCTQCMYFEIGQLNWTQSSFCKIK